MARLTREAVVYTGRNVMTEGKQKDRLAEYQNGYRAKRLGVDLWTCPECGRKFPKMEKQGAHRMPRPNNFLRCPGA